MAEQQSTVSMGNVTSADLQSNEAEREQAFREFMQGSPFGAPPRQEQIGIGSQNPDELINRPTPKSAEQEMLDQHQRLTELMEPVAEASALQAEVDDWKKKFGDRENEFGEMRRAKQELEETLQLMLQQQVAPQNFTQPNYSQPNYSQPLPPALMSGRDPFEGISDEDVMTAGQLKKLVGAYIAPGMAESWQKADATERALAAVRQQSYNDSKAAAGIKPLDELRLKTKFPYLAAMPDTAEKVSIMRSLLGPKEQPVAQPTITAPQRVEAPRRITHIEGSTGAAGEPNANPNAAFQVEMAAAERLPFHQRAQAMQLVLNKYKVPTANTFGAGRYRI